MIYFCKCNHKKIPISFETITKRQVQFHCKQKRKAIKTFLFLVWRRERDLNSWYLISMPVFGTGTFDRSDISAYYLIKLLSSFILKIFQALVKSILGYKFIFIYYLFFDILLYYFSYIKYYKNCTIYLCFKIMHKNIKPHKFIII